MRKILSVFIVLIIFFQPSFANSLKQNSKIDSIILPNLSNKLIDVNQQSLNKPYLISFILFQNKNTTNILDYYKSLLSQYPNKINIFVISLDVNEQNILPYKKFENNPGLYLLSDQSQRYVNPMQILILPTTFLVNTQGLLNNIYVNFDNKTLETISKDIALLIK